MKSIEFTYLLPLIILASAPVVTILAVSVFRNHRLIFFLSVLSMVFFILASINLWSTTSEAYQVHELLVIDRFALFYFVLIGAAGLLILLISYSYLSQQNLIKEEYYVLLKTSVFGAAVLVASDNFVSLFLGLEILSISLYAIIAYITTRQRCIEGGLKYLILAAGSSAFLLFGMALIYVDTGVMSFTGLEVAFPNMGFLSTAGLAMMLVGIGFKLALVPFHTWTPDIYEGAPAPVSALIATISKGGVVALLLRFLHSAGGLELDWMMWTFTAMAIASMLAGNILALRQENIKRLLAYSSIAHLGYLLVAIIAGNSLSIEAVTFYLVAYFISIIGAFGTLAVFSAAEGEIEQVEDLRGIFWTRPVLSVVFSAMFFSLVGIPLTAGFMGKFYIVWAAINEGMWILALVLVLGSVIGLYYYLRVLKTMLSPQKNQSRQLWRLRPSFMGVTVLMLLGALVIILGVFPSGLIEVIRVMGFGF